MSQMENLLEDLYEGYLFKLVVFPNDKTSNNGNESDEESQGMIEAVPSTWIEWNPTLNILECYWMPGVSTKKTQARFLALLKRASPPDTAWPKFKVEIKGRVKTYEDVKKALKDVRNRRYAYSTDDEIGCHKKALEEIKKYQRKTVSSAIPATVDTLDNFTVDLRTTRESQKNMDFNHNDTQRDVDRSNLRNSTSPISHTPTGINGKKKKSRRLTKHKSNSPSNEMSQRSSSAERSETGMSDLEDRWLNNRSPSQSPAKSIDGPVSIRAIVHERDQGKGKITPSKKINSASGNPRGLSRAVEVSSKTPAEQQERESPLRRLDSCGISKSRIQMTPVSSHRDSSRAKNTPLRNIESRSKMHHLSMVEEEKEMEKVEDLTIFIKIVRSGEEKTEFRCIPTMQTSASCPARRGSKKDPNKYLTVEHYNSLVKRIADLKGMVVTSIQIMKDLQATVQIHPRATADDNFEHEAEALEDIQLPCCTMDSFDEFNDMLQNNREFRKKILRKIENSVNKKRPISRCLGDIMRTFVSNDVGDSLVPVKPTPNKKVFKATKLCDLLRYVYTRAYGAPGNPLSDGEFTKALQGVLHNTKYWKVADRQADGHQNEEAE